MQIVKNELDQQQKIIAKFAFIERQFLNEIDELKEKQCNCSAKEVTLKRSDTINTSKQGYLTCED